MKSIISKVKSRLTTTAYLTIWLLLISSAVVAQDDSLTISKSVAPAKQKPVKNTFNSVWIIDNQTVMVPVKGTFEMDIQHRFGIVTKGYDDFWGFFAPSNIRMGVSYAPINNLYLGIGITKANMLWDASAKYSILTQTNGKYPVSITYYGNVAYDTRKDADKSLFKYREQRVSFFNQVIIARKISDKFSVQIAPSLSHQNSVNGYYTKNDSTGKVIFEEMKHNHFAVAVSARYRLTNVTSFLINYDQPITKHAKNNPLPNLSFGVEFNTSSHSFQLFCGNYSYLSPQRNNLYNTNAPFAYTDQLADGSTKKMSGGQFLIGFNITRLWNY